MRAPIRDDGDHRARQFSGFLPRCDAPRSRPQRPTPSARICATSGDRRPARDLGPGGHRLPPLRRRRRRSRAGSRAGSTASRCSSSSAGTSSPSLLLDERTPHRRHLNRVLLVPAGPAPAARALPDARGRHRCTRCSSCRDRRSLSSRATCSRRFSTSQLVADLRGPSLLRGRGTPRAAAASLVARDRGAVLPVLAVRLLAGAQALRPRPHAAGHDGRRRARVRVRDGDLLVHWVDLERLVLRDADPAVGPAARLRARVLCGRRAACAASPASTRASCSTSPASSASGPPLVVGFLGWVPIVKWLPTYEFGERVFRGGFLIVDIATVARDRRGRPSPQRPRTGSSGVGVLVVDRSALVRHLPLALPDLRRHPQRDIDNFVQQLPLDLSFYPGKLWWS